MAGWAPSPPCPSNGEVLGLQGETLMTRLLGQPPPSKQDMSPCFLWGAQVPVPGPV